MLGLGIELGIFQFAGGAQSTEPHLWRENLKVLILDVPGGWGCLQSRGGRGDREVSCGPTWFWLVCVGANGRRDRCKDKEIEMFSGVGGPLQAQWTLIVHSL